MPAAGVPGKRRGRMLVEYVTRVSLQLSAKRLAF
jgi:hypothetical protein